MYFSPTAIRCFIWGCNEEAMARHESLTVGAIKYAHAALGCGLDGDDIADDLLERYSDMFHDVDVEFHGTEMHIICLPNGMMPSPPMWQ